MLAEQARFNERRSFAYAVLTSDGTRERGCLYIRPSSRPAFDAEVVMWLHKRNLRAGLMQSSSNWAQNWISSSWPMSKVVYPGRSLAWNEWDAL